MWHWLLFEIKRFCDWQLYGHIQVPSKHCDRCGRPYGTESLAPPYHARCAPQAHLNQPALGPAIHSGKVCPRCHQPILAGQSVTPPYHAACAPSRG